MEMLEKVVTFNKVSSMISSRKLISDDYYVDSNLLQHIHKTRLESGL